MGVDHRGPDVFMPEQFLHGPDVITGCEQVRRKRVPKRVAGDAFGEPRGAGNIIPPPLVQIVALVLA